MDSQRWHTIRTAFDELVQLDADSQAGRLAALGETDPELREAVQSLLDADAEAGARLAPLDEILVPQGELVADPLNLVGRTISNFQVEEPLGAGGMGVVYRGQDTRLGRPVALKFLLPHYSLDTSAKNRFLREARSAAALDHPHLCTIYDVREGDNGRLFLAMALYAGETLKERLARDGPLPLAEAIAITRQISHGVGCAHAAGIVHRDLKPGNVMLLPDGTVKILDFGLAKALDESATETGQGFGTVAYMAPEQIRGQQVDQRADLWALGVVLYEMLTGRKPFAGDHELAIAHAILHDDPAPPSIHRNALPAAVENIVLALLQKEPSVRYAGVDELIADLATVGAVDESTGRSMQWRRLFRRRRPVARSTWMMTLAAGLVVGGAGGAALALRLRPDRPTGVSRYPIALPDTAGLAAVPYGFRIAISPGGEHLVYVGGGPDESNRLWVWSRDRLNLRPLPGTEGAINPFFSPDGSRVGFVTIEARGTLKVVSLDGGSPTTVIDSLVDSGGAAWGYDGYIYFDAAKYGIGRVLETGGAPEPVTMHDGASGEMWHYQPEPLPNGRGVLFDIRRDGPMSESDIAVVDLESGIYHVLLRGLSPRYTPSGHLVYATVDGSMMAVPFDQDRLTITGEPVILAEGLQIQSLGEADLAISTTGTFAYVAGRVPPGQNGLVWVTRAGEATQIDTAWRADFGPLELSPDGSALAVSVTQGGDFHIWLKQLDRGPASKLSQGAFNAFPSWTPDGQALTFVGDSGLRLARADGSVPPRLLRREAGSLREVEFSSDGRWLLYRNNADLFAARTEGDTTRVTLVATRFREFTPRLSPDGRWLAYTSDVSGRREVYVRSFPDTRSVRVLVSNAGGVDPVWSRDGRELLYKNGRNELVAAAVSSGATFTIEDQHVLFSTAEYEGYGDVGKWYDVSPDGSRFIMIRLPDESRDELILVENFFEELKAKIERTAGR
jgi:Tol biopolymer transport system component